MRNVTFAIVMVLVLSCSASATAAEWELYTQNKIEKYYIDSESIKPHRQYSVGMYEYIAKIVRDVDIERDMYGVGKGVEKTTALIYKRNIIDCRTMETASVSFVAYNKSGMKIHEFNYDVMGYGPGIGDDVIALRFACDKIKQTK